VVGVNGVGKTTSIAKLAYRYIHQGKKVLLVAADTFRAGAVEQLSVWAKRLGCEIVTGSSEADPASVAYDGMQKAKEIHADFVIVDTAGRLQTKANLMMELSKIKRVINKEINGAPQETFLIIDATTGQNGVVQAKAFAEVTNLTGVIITKMDGTSKGGIILAIRDEFNVPVRFIGLGEKMDDLAEFDLDKYLYGLCVGE
jgi:fused signal recognition particle receptor